MPWFKVDDLLHDHKKVRGLRADRLAAVGLWTLCGSWAAHNLTDGFVPAEIVTRYDPKERTAKRLVDVGLWSRAEQDGEPGYQFHEWDEHQPLREEVLLKREAARERMRKVRGQRATGSQDVRANTPRTEREVRLTPTRPDPTHRELPTEVLTSDAACGDADPPMAAPTRADVERICRHLADKIEENGSKRPTITKEWRRQARLLLDKDKRTVEQVIKAIDWCQASAFWRPNIMSMPKLREQYDRLRLEAQRAAATGKASPTSGANRHIDRRDDNPFRQLGATS